MKVTEMKQKVKQSISYQDFSEVISKTTFLKLLGNTIMLNGYMLWINLKAIFGCLWEMLIFPFSHKKMYKTFLSSKVYDKIYEELSKK